jgi:YfiR/HmsC-like
VNRPATKTQSAKKVFGFAGPVNCVSIWISLWLALAGFATAADNAGLAEYQVKAAYLYNFTKFTDWPDNAFTSADAPIVIGIVGKDPFGKTLDELVSGEIVRGHPLVIKRLSASEDLRGCQVLFICREEKSQLPALLQKLKASPILTVSDFPDFTDQGGMVNLMLVQDKVKLEVNQTSAEQSGLKISAKLLKLARVVNYTPSP